MALNNAEITSERKDEEILALSINEPSAFEFLVDRYQDAFLRAATKIVHQKEDAEDVVQDAFVKIYMNADRFKKVEGASFKSWAYKIVINTALTRYGKLKKTWGKVEYLDSMLYKGFDVMQSDKVELEADAKMIVIKLLAEMPDNLREVLEKYYLEDKSQKDIAKEEGVSLGTVKMRVFRAKKELKKVVDKNKDSLIDDMVGGIKMI